MDIFCYIVSLSPAWDLGYLKFCPKKKSRSGQSLVLDIFGIIMNILPSASESILCVL